jgi:predicted dehydrogenase
MGAWKVGIVGLSRGKGLVSAFRAHPRVQVTGLCDLDGNALAEAGQAFGLPDSGLFTDFDAFLNAPMDVVVVATPIPHHAEQSIKSLKTGKHVLCEQTAAYTVKECESVVDAVRRTGKAYMMAENYCYFHYIREWKKIVEQGKLGHIFYAEGEYIHEIIDLLINEKTGQYHWRHERPPIWYCAHTLGPILMLMGDRVVRGSGLTSGFGKMPAYKDHPGFLDIEVGLFQTQKGAIVKILRSQVASRPHMVWYSLYGTNGHLEGQRDRGDGLYYVEGEMDKHQGGQPFPCPTSDPDAPPAARHGGHGTSEYYMIRDFLDALDAGRQPPIDVMRAMDFTVPGIIAHESAMKGGKWMDVPLFNW